MSVSLSVLSVCLFVCALCFAFAKVMWISFLFPHSGSYGESRFFAANDDPISISATHHRIRLRHSTTLRRYVTFYIERIRSERKMN